MTAELPPFLTFELRAAFDDGVQFGFQRVVRMIDSILPSTHSEIRAQVFKFVRDWCESTALEIAMDAPSAEEVT
jgi:hypothetical protein